MRVSSAIFALVMFSTLLLIAVPIPSVKAQWTPIWESEVHSKCCPPVTSLVLDAGREYRITAWGTFASYNMSGIVEYAADAYYYTILNVPTSPAPDIWVWDNYHPAPDGHSFLQIDGNDVNWGPFNNGITDPWGGHEYTIYYTGTGAPITFQIVEWMDPLRDCELNYCHFHVRIDEGPPPPLGETAYAYGGDYATCFKYWGFKNWGWSNGPLGHGNYTFDIYAGAAKCNINKGTKVGTLIISYVGSTAWIAYFMDPGWAMERTHLYVDGEPLPQNGGEYTTSPGLYPYIHDPVADPTYDDYLVSGLSGDIYVVAHADVIEA